MKTILPLTEPLNTQKVGDRNIPDFIKTIIVLLPVARCTNPLRALSKHTYAILRGFKAVKMILLGEKEFLIFTQNKDRGYTLECLTEAVLTSTHNLCIRLKNKDKNVYP